MDDERARSFFELLARQLGTLRERALEAGRDGLRGPDGRSDAAPDSEAPGPGEPLGRIGPYRVMERIGSGGMGAVHRAVDTRLDREVALKFLPPYLAGDSEAAERLLSEARAAAALDHPNICTIYQVGLTDRGLPFIAMALYRGQTLRERIRRGSLPVGEAVRVASAVARGLRAAHARGIVHRDVKPGNVMLTEEGGVKLLDFGLARTIGASLTRSGLLRGTVAYMAPEQARGEPVDARTDLWALGVVLHEMLSGERPFRGEYDRAVLNAILHEEPRPIRETRPEVPGRLADLVGALLAKAPADRPADAGAVLESLGVSDGPAVRVERGGSLATRRSPRRLLPAAARAVSRHRLALGVGAAAIAAAGALLWKPVSRPAPALDAHLVGVLPFRVAGADPSLSYLGKGMEDLLAARLGGTGDDLRAVDPQRLERVWRSAGGTDSAVLDRKAELRLARRLNSRYLVRGSVTSLPGRTVLSASLIDAADGTMASPVTVRGPEDSLPALIDRLAGALLSLEADPKARLGSLAGVPLEALKAYLRGRAEYRLGRFDRATEAFERAVRIDSTFAEAAAMAWRSGKDGSRPRDPKLSGLFELAWEHRDQLDDRDRAFLASFRGPNDPSHFSPEDYLASRKELVRQQPDYPDAWYMLGAMTVRAEGPMGLPDSTILRDAARDQRHALALDSAFLPSLLELWMLAVPLDDTAAMGRYARAYLARSPTGTDAEMLRCVQSALAPDRPPIREILARADSAGLAATRRCLFHYHYVSGLWAARDTAAAWMAARIRRRPDPESITRYGLILHDFAHDRGRPAEAAGLESLYARIVEPDSLRFGSLTTRVRDALWWDGDRSSGARAADSLATDLDRRPPSAPDDPRVKALCALGEWRLDHGDLERAAPIIDRLRALGGDDTTWTELYPNYCARVLDVWRADLRGTPDGAADAELARLQTFRAREPRDARLSREGALIVARVLTARGDTAGALQAIRRARWELPPEYRSTLLRERGRLAAAQGDTADAVDCLRRFLALRSDPEPSMEPGVREIRRELIRLGGTDPVTSRALPDAPR